MGFLSGVLGAVKDDDAVKTYDEYMENKLENVLNTLKDNIGSGREGLVESVGEVKGWLEGYEGEVNRKTDVLKNLIKSLVTRIEQHKQLINSEKDEHITTQIAYWTARAGQYIQLTEKADQELKNLDPTLSDKLKCKIDMLLQATKTFKQSAEIADLGDIYELVGIRGNEVSVFLTEQTYMRMKELQEYMAQRIAALSNRLIVLQSEHYTALKQAVCRNLAGAFDMVNECIEAIIRKYNSAVIVGAGSILQSAGNLRHEIIKEKEKLNKQVKELELRIGELKEAAENVMNVETKDTNEIRNKFELIPQIEKVKDVIETNVKTHVASMLGDIKRDVGTIKGHVGEPKLPGQNNPEDKSIYYNWDSIKVEITTLADKIKGEGTAGVVHNTEGLIQIRKGVSDYAMKIDEGDFVRVLTTWADKMVDEVKGEAHKYIEYYVTTNTQNMRSQFDPQYAGHKGVKAVKEAIKAALPGFIIQAVRNAADEAELDDTVDASNIAEKFKQFSSHLEGDIRNVDVNLASTEIELQLELTQVAGSLNYNKTYLHQAIATIVNAVAATAKYFAREIHSFLGKSKIENIEMAITLAGNINKLFETSSKSHGHMISGALSNVHSEIRNLHDGLRNALNAANSADITDDNADLAQKVYEIKVKSTTNNFEGSLDALLQKTADKAIGKMHTKVSEIIGGPLNALQPRLHAAETRLEGIRITLNELQSKPGNVAVTTSVQGGRSDLHKKAVDLHTEIETFLENTIGRNKGDGQPKDDTLYRGLLNLKQLVANLGVNVQDVVNKLDKLSSELNRCMTVTDAFFNEAPKITESAFNQLRNAVNAKILDCVRSVKALTEDLYTKRKTTEVEALQKIVNDQFDCMTEIIGTDVTNGVKGLIKELKNNHESLNPLRDEEDKGRINGACAIVKHYLNDILTHMKVDLENPSHLKPLIYQLPDHIDTLLDDLSKHHFDHRFTKNLDELLKYVDQMRPRSLSEPSNPLAEALKKCMDGFCTELGKAYVNIYSGQNWEREFRDNYGKIGLTIFVILKCSLNTLRHNCKSLKGERINRSTNVGRLLAENGYIVSDDKAQNGELQDRPGVLGLHINKKLGKTTATSDQIKHLALCKNDNEGSMNDEDAQVARLQFNVMDLLDCLFRHCEKYNEVCHLSTYSSSRLPCTVHDMLCWFTGLPYSGVYPTLLSDGFTDLLEKPKKQTIQSNDDLEIEFFDHKAQYLNAYPHRITYNNIDTVLGHLCSKSYDLLTAIAGYGDVHTVYASDFCNNSMKLRYPSKPADCLDMLLDILRRLLLTLQYLRVQCNLDAKHGGWKQCEYGKTIKTTNWPCKDHSSDEPNGQPKCQPTSPLLSYLNDCLPGRFPHQLGSIGCKYDCSTCSKSKPGTPCLTPLGFRGFSGSTRTGKELCETISFFLGNGLVLSLLTLIPKPPSTLPEHVAFALSFVRGWHDSKNADAIGVKTELESKLKDMSIDLYKKPSDLTAAFRRAYGSRQNSHGLPHLPGRNADLSSLFMTKFCEYPGINVYCAPYMQSLCHNYYHYIAHEHSKLYLSWSLYLPWAFWECLNSLLNSFCNIICKDWGCRSCLHNDACTPGKHGDENHPCQCNSMVTCIGVAPTFYQYGFTFGDASLLNNGKTPKKCTDFCNQLRNVLYSEYFRDLFTECDSFIWTIRKPFTYLVLALWSLSLFYLICVMVGRLDVLHIRSHLRIPSSHKITAQSLLAAAQVGRLAKIWYLQP